MHDANAWHTARNYSSVVTPFGALRDGIRRVLSAPSVLVSVWALTALVALPLTLAIRAEIAGNLDHSLAAEDTARGMNYEWMQEFAGQGSGLATTVRPTIVGFAAVLDNLSALMDNIQRPAAVAAASGAFVLLWVFLSGGVIERYAAARPGRRGFLASCTAWFFRMFRLALVTAVVYGLLFGVLHPLLFTRFYPRLVRGVDLERTAFMIRGGLYLVFLFFLAAVNLVFDFAKVRAVVEDRRSMLVAIVASWRFIRADTAGAAGVYLLDALLFALTLAVYSYIAPAGGGIGMMVWPTVAIGQLYILARLAIRLLFFASETAMVEARLGVRRH
jgi:hypothetical protein